MKARICIIIAILLLACNSNKTPREEIKSDTVATLPVTDSGNNNVKNDSVTLNAENNVEVNKLIVPGESTGKAVLNMDAAGLEKKFGKPDMSDAAMGKAWLTWYGKKDEHNSKTELNIYTTYKDTTIREKTVQQIRTTSSFFSTENKVHVYSSLNEISIMN